MFAVRIMFRSATTLLGFTFFLSAFLFWLVEGLRRMEILYFKFCNIEWALQSLWALQSRWPIHICSSSWKVNWFTPRTYNYCFRTKSCPDSSARTQKKVEICKRKRWCFDKGMIWWHNEGFTFVMNKISFRCACGSDRQEKIYPKDLNWKKTRERELGHIGRKSNEIHYERWRSCKI